MMTRSFILCTMAIIAAAPAANAQVTAADQNADTARETVTRMAEYLKGLPACQFNLTTKNLTTADGLHMEYHTTYSVLVERPGRYALRQERGMSGPHYICDAQNLTIYVPYARQYAVSKAPAGVIEALDPERLGYLGEFYRSFLLDAPGLRTLLAADPVAATAGILTSVEYVGLEKIDGVAAHHLAVSNDPRAHHLWIAAGDQPYPVRFTYRPTSNDWDPAEFWGKSEVLYSATVTHWNPSPKFTDESFAFTAPEGVEQVDDLAEAMMGGGMDGFEEEEDHAALLGVEAPAFEIPALDGAPVSLASLREGGRVVVLDFWATWCPPCRAGLPVLVEAMKGYKDDQAVFYAINLMEDVPTIRRFLEGEKLDLKVLLDAEGAVAEQYGVSGIPQTVIIGPDGTIQSIHVGFDPGVGEQLKKEIDTLLRGESLVEARREERQANLDLAELDEIWSLDGRWQSVSVDDAGRIFALDARQRLVRITPEGLAAGDVRLEAPGNILRLARLVEDASEPAAITFGVWSQDVIACAADGKRLWTYPRGDGVDDVWAADLDGDGLDEVIIGYNGGGGLHVLSHTGELLWKYTRIGNVWHVAAADVNGDGRPEVITTSATGQVHVFDRDGKNLGNHSTGLYTNMVRSAPRGSLHAGAIFAGGSRMAGGDSVIRLSQDGQVQWKAGLPGERSTIDSMAVACGSPLLAVSTRAGRVHIYDTSEGALLADYAPGSSVGDVAWLEPGDPQEATLLIATADALLAVRQRP